MRHMTYDDDDDDDDNNGREHVVQAFVKRLSKSVWPHANTHARVPEGHAVTERIRHARCSLAIKGLCVVLRDRIGGSGIADQ